MGLRYCSKQVLFSLVLTFTAPLHGAETAEAAFQRAASALQHHDYLEAESGFKSVLKLEPANIGALGNLGVVYSQTQRYTLAIDAYRRALRIAPRDKSLLLNLGLAHIKQEQFAAALPIFEQLARDLANLQARELLASCQVSTGQFAAALVSLNPLTAAEPNNPGVLYMQGIALTRLKRGEEAKAVFARMMSVSNTAQANFLMGKASYETGDFEQAAGFFTKAVDADPALAGVHRELGKTFTSLHRDEDAERELRAAGP